MSADDHVVYVVDDDDSSRRSLEFLLKVKGFRVRSFASPKAFLGFARPEMPGCVVLDVRMPGLTGLEVQEELSMVGFEIPIIFMTGHCDTPISARAIKAGAVEFLTKPYRGEDMLRAVTQALERDRAARAERLDRAELSRRYAQLTPREREVMARVVILNKQLAANPGASETTVTTDCWSVMKKMEAKSLADLLRMAGKL